VEAEISCPDRPGGHARDAKKPHVILSGKQQLVGVYETKIPNTIDALRDGTSFPEDCGERRI
jgi:hypothetical protein